ncbi:MAG: hypothetical protein ACRC4N_14215 [Gammaproteobacteria bacterium]
MLNQLEELENQEITSVDDSIKITVKDVLQEYKEVFLSMSEQSVLSKAQIDKVVKNARLMEQRIKELEEENKDYENLVEAMQKEIDEFKRPPQEYSENVPEQEAKTED